METTCRNGLGAGPPKRMLFPERRGVLDRPTLSDPALMGKLIHKALWLAACLSELKETNCKSWFLGGHGYRVGNIRASQIAILGKVSSSTIPVVSSQQCCGRCFYLSTP